jgi:hypothetical protein
MRRLFLLLAALTVAITLPASTLAQGAAPHYVVDTTWPKPLPNNWLLGQIGGMAVDKNDHIWVFQRPRSLTDDEKGVTLKPPRSQCCVPAPAVLEFDGAGNVLRSWGGPGAGYEWPANEHGITIDAEGYVWLTGNGDNDGQILKFTQDGKFLKQIGHEGPSEGSNSKTQMGRPASVTVDVPAHEVYVADGYKNRRVVVFDSVTGAYKRHWGAYGKPPNDDPLPPYDPNAPPLQGFRNPVHCVRIAQDGLVYVCDRAGDRYQVFHKDGTFVKEVFIKKETLGNGSMWDLNFTQDPGQPYLLNADGENDEVRVLSRDTGAILSIFGRSGRQAGDFHWVHTSVTDSKGNLYTGEVDNAKRIQKFKRV